MRNNTKTLVKILLAAGAVATPIIYAYEYGPNAGYTAAPGDNATGCIASGCHVGTPNSGPGSVTITAPGGTTYLPGGPAQTITVTISDATEKKYGFQLSARVDSNPKTTQAGILTAGGDGFTQVICTDGSPSAATGCAAATGSTLQWIEHTLAGYGKSGTPPSYTYTFSWTPPATNVGTVTLYASGNAVTGALVVTGAHDYLTKLTLSPGAANPNPPSINPGGINPLYSSATTIQPGAWAQMYGTNLGPSGVTLWKGDFAATLGGITVTVNGKPASLYFVSPTQLNFQAPDDTATGSVPVAVTTANGTATSIVTLGTVGPSFLLLNGLHVTGIILRPDGSGSQSKGTAGSYDLLGPTGSSFGYPTVAAKAGDTIELFGVGFGPTNPPVTAGKALAPGVFGTATNTIQLTINGKTLTPSFAGITQAGLYQFNLTLPAGLGTGDVPLLGTVAGVQTPSNVVISLQ
jgi:uncharacterized protein (TIGR03437 family)